MRLPRHLDIQLEKYNESSGLRNDIKWTFDTVTIALDCEEVV